MKVGDEIYVEFTTGGRPNDDYPTKITRIGRKYVTTTGGTRCNRDSLWEHEYMNSRLWLSVAEYDAHRECMDLRENVISAARSVAVPLPSGDANKLARDRLLRALHEPTKP
jgi:hypothetical protein